MCIMIITFEIILLRKDFVIKFNFLQMHLGHPEWRSQPNYSLLVDIQDRGMPQTTYVPEENIELIESTVIMHPNVEDFFENYNGLQYIPRPWLRKLYPLD